MAEVNGVATQATLTNTITLTNDYQELFSYAITNGMVVITMTETGVNIGGAEFLISGTKCKCTAYTGGPGFDASTDLALLPLSYGASSNQTNYTIWFSYDNNKLKVCKSEQDPAMEIVFTGLFSSAVDTFTNSTLSVDKIVESTTNNGTTFTNKVNFNGVVNIGNNSNTNSTINIGTNSSAGGRTINVGNTVSGSSLVLNGVIETPDVQYGTISFTNSADITWTDVSSVAMRIGKLCQVTIKANLAASANIAAGSAQSFFSVTPTNRFLSSYVCSGSLHDNNSHDCGLIYNTANSADFKLTIPTAVAANDSTTIIATIVYLSV